MAELENIVSILSLESDQVMIRAEAAEFIYVLSRKEFQESKMTESLGI